MKVLRFVALMIACLLMISAITGVKQFESSGTSVSITRYTGFSRLVAFILALFFGLWYWTLKKNKITTAKRITSGLFAVAIIDCLLQAILGGFVKGPIFAKGWLVLSQVLCAAIVYWLWQKSLQAIDRGARKENGGSAS